MDQANLAAGITHKRRLSALGPGGLSRETRRLRGPRRPQLPLRPHVPHPRRLKARTRPYRLGLATFGRINPYGFIETPYRRVVDGKGDDDIDYLTADEEENHTIAQANEQFNLETREFGTTDERQLREGLPRALPYRDADGVFGDFWRGVLPEQVDYMDVSPRQMTSVATSLIPFLEHDDANRALMG